MPFGSNPKPVVTEWILNNEGLLVNVAKQAKAIRAEAKAEKELKLVTESLGLAITKTENASAGMTRATESMSKGMTIAKMTIANLATQGIGVLKEALFDATKEAASFARASDIYRGNLEGARAATQGLAKDVDIMVAKNRLATLGVKMTDAEYNKMLGSLTKISGAMNIDLKFAIESATTMLARQSTAVADNVGVVIKAEEAYKKYADKVHKTVQALTDSEKKIAFQQEALSQLTTKAAALGDRTKTASDEFVRMTTAAKNATSQIVSTIIQTRLLTSTMSDAAIGVKSLADALSREMGAGGKEADRTMSRMYRLNELRKEIEGAGFDMAGRPTGKDRGAFEAARAPGTQIYARVQAWAAEAAQIQKAINEVSGYEKALDKLKQKNPRIRKSVSMSQFDDIAGGVTPGQAIEKARKGKGTKGTKPVDRLDLGILPDDSKGGTLPDFKTLFPAEAAADALRQKEALDATTAALKRKAEAEKKAADAAQEHSDKMKAAADALNQMGIGALANFTGGLFAAADAAIMAGEGMGAAVGKMVKATLLGIATQAAVKGAFEMAEGFSMLAKIVTAPLAPGHFLAAGKFFAVAALAGAGGLAMSAGGVGASSSTGKTSATSSTSSTASSSPSFGQQVVDKRPQIWNVYIGDPKSGSAALLARKEIEIQNARALAA